MGTKLKLVNGATTREYFTRSAAETSEHVQIGSDFLDLISTPDHDSPRMKFNDGVNDFYPKTVYGKKMKSVELYCAFNTGAGFYGQGFNHLTLEHMDGMNILSGVYPSYASKVNDSYDMPFYGSWSSVTDSDQNSVAGFRRDTSDTSGNNYCAHMTMRWDFAELKEISFLHCQFFRAEYDTDNIDDEYYRIRYKDENDVWYTLLSQHYLYGYYRSYYYGSGWTHRVGKYEQNFAAAWQG